MMEQNVQHAAWLGDGAPADQAQLRRSLGLVPTGVTVITTVAPDGRRVGLTANSFASVSMDPPLILWSLSNRSANLDLFAQCSHFAINVLAHDQEDLCKRFATAGIADKFAGIAGRPGMNGVPLLDGAVAQFECSAHAQYPGGDHRIFIGRIDAHRWSNRTPLLFCQGVLMPASHEDSRQAQT
ncbi:flavin reductase family protein [Actimicrobium antarcticum]|uniref:Flavin reductase family protein n=1 Tax=Actimicrobium antarcticum TaxID=1051899 RepID=A0ABP7SXR4_9BURK